MESNETCATLLDTSHLKVKFVSFKSDLKKSKVCLWINECENTLVGFGKTQQPFKNETEIVF